MYFKEPWQEQAAKFIVENHELFGTLPEREAALCAIYGHLCLTDNPAIGKFALQPIQLGLSQSKDSLRNGIEAALCVMSRHACKKARMTDEIIYSLYKNTPRLDTARTISQTAMQQYSTPVLVGYAAARYLWQCVDLRAGKTLRILEPTCGVGLLLSPLVGKLDARGISYSITAAEIDPKRRDIFQHLFPEAEVFGNVSEIFNGNQEGFDIALINPPFGNRQGIMHFDHWCVLECLKKMKEGAYFAAIIGGHTEFNARNLPQNYDFFNELFSRTNCTVYDSLIPYTMGTGYPYRLILGQKTSANPTSQKDTVPRKGNACYKTIEYSPEHHWFEGSHEGKSRRVF